MNKPQSCKINNQTVYNAEDIYNTEEYDVKNVPKMMNIINQELYKYEEAPKILELENNEKFKDKNNKIINIEIRGEREHNKIYFKVKDVSVSFEMPNLNDTILRDISKYELNIHYKFFIINNSDKSRILTSKKFLYLTYNGILHLCTFKTPNKRLKKYTKM